MFDTILKSDNSAFQYYDNIEIYTEDIREAFSIFDMYSTNLLSENSTFILNMEELICETVFNYDTELLVFLNEGIIGATINTIKNIIGTAFIFLKKLIAKMNMFIDQYTASNTKWYNTYASKVKAKANMARGFTYEGHRWDMSYMTAAPYPDLTKELAVQSKVIKEASKNYTTLLQSGNVKGEDFKSIEEDLQKSFPNGFKQEAKDKYEDKLKCKVEEASDVYYKKGSGGEVMSIEGFKSVSIDTMLNHIKDSHLMIEEVNKSMEKMAGEINAIVAVIDKIDAQDFESKIAKATNNEKAVNESYSLLNEGKKDNKKPKPESTGLKFAKEKSKEYDADKYHGKNKIAAAAKEVDEEKPESDSKPEKESEKVRAEEGSAAMEYTKTLRTVLNDSVSTWRLTLSIVNKLHGTRTALIKDSNREFIKVLTRFIGKKQSEGE